MAIENRLIRHQIFLERFAGTVARQMQLGIDRARDVVIAATLPNLDAVNPTVLQERIVATLNASMQNAFGEVNDLTEAEAEFIIRLLNGEVDEEAQQPTQEQLTNALVNTNMPVGLAEGENNRNIVVAYEKFARDNSRLLVQPVRDAQTTGGDPLTATAAVTALAAGLLASRARSLSRASVVHAADTSRMTVYKENRNIVKEVEWVSVLDSRTTNFCRNQDGKRYPVGQGPRPPAHYNCRSLTRPIINEEAS